MKTQFALSLLAAALLPACTTTTTTKTETSDDKAVRYANNSIGEPIPPAEGPEADIPSEGPRDVNANPAFIPTPLLRTSAAAGP